MTDQWNDLQRQQMAEVERMRAQAQQQPPNELQPYYEQPPQPPNYGQQAEQLPPVELQVAAPQLTRVVTAKNPGVAVLLTIPWPGIGHLYAGNTRNGLLCMLLFTPLAWLLTLIGAWPAVFIWWAGAMKWAYKDAKRFNERNGIQVK